MLTNLYSLDLFNTAFTGVVPSELGLLTLLMQCPDFSGEHLFHID